MVNASTKYSSKTAKPTNNHKAQLTILLPVFFQIQYITPKSAGFGP